MRLLDDFARFIVKRFQHGRREVSVDTARRIIETVSGVSGDVQEFCAALWDVTSNGETISENDFAHGANIRHTNVSKEFRAINFHPSITSQS